MKYKILTAIIVIFLLGVIALADVGVNEKTNKGLVNTQNLYKFEYPKNANLTLEKQLLREQGYTIKEIQLHVDGTFILVEYDIMNEIETLRAIIQIQNSTLNKIKTETCAKDNTYSWCIK